MLDVQNIETGRTAMQIQIQYISYIREYENGGFERQYTIIWTTNDTT